MKNTQKCTKYQEIWLFKANFRIEWVKSPLLSEYNLLKHVSVQKVETDLMKQAYLFVQRFSNDKEEF